MRGLYARLRSIGLSTPYVRAYLLPEWWDDDAAATPAGFTEALWTVARHLGVRPEELREQAEPLRLPPGATVQYKLAADTTPEHVALARRLGEQVARFALLGAPPLVSPTCPDALGLRRRMLDAGAPWVSFPALLEQCWSLGIPVLHVPEFPKGTTRKMDGMAVNLGGRPAIVLCSRRRQAAWQLFVLAHEIGHIGCGHIGEGAAVVDGEVDGDSVDPQEREANAFALELITGKPDTTVVSRARWPKAEELAALARQFGERLAVDPGHLVLNYAHSMSGNFWPVANAALRLLEGDGDPAEMVRERLSARLDWSALPAEAAEFVARMTGLQTHSRS